MKSENHEMRELTVEETNQVSGGIIPVILVAIAAYEAAKAISENTE